MNCVSSGTIYHNGLFICCSYVALTKGMEYHIPGSSLKNFATGKITWLVSSVTMMFRGYSLDGQPHLLSVASSPAHLCSIRKNNQSNIRVIFYYRGAPVAQRAAKWSTILIKERKGNPCMDFLMVFMTSGIARRRPRTTTTTTSCHMVTVLEVMGLTETCSLAEHLWYWTYML